MESPSFHRAVMAHLPSVLVFKQARYTLAKQRVIIHKSALAICQVLVA
jgi:hypothetical protein